MFFKEFFLSFFRNFRFFKFIFRKYPENQYINREYGRVLHEKGSVDEIEEFLPIFEKSINEGSV